MKRLKIKALNAAETMIKIEKANKQDIKSINQLLENEQLPIVEEAEFSDHLFKVLDNNKSIIGAIGLERYGRFGLLRSMVVDPKYRNKGIANQLVETIKNQAKETKLDEIYLLTQTAEKYFLKKGFVPVIRNNVPEEIKKSKEFSSLCPVSSVVMNFKI